jgi:hypothetical protein
VIASSTTTMTRAWPMLISPAAVGGALARMAPVGFMSMSLMT